MRCHAQELSLDWGRAEAGRRKEGSKTSEGRSKGPAVKSAASRGNETRGSSFAKPRVTSTEGTTAYSTSYGWDPGPCVQKDKAVGTDRKPSSNTTSPSSVPWGHSHFWRKTNPDFLPSSPF